MARPTDDEFVEFAQLSLGELNRVGYLFCGDWHRAEDATQEALVRLYASWHRIRDPQARRAWTRRTLLRILVDEARRPRRRERSTATVPDSLGVDPTAASDTHDELVRALQELPARRRACVVLRYQRELSVSETADALGISEGTVKSQTSRGLAELQRILTRHSSSETDPTRHEGPPGAAPPPRPAATRVRSSTTDTGSTPMLAVPASSFTPTLPGAHHA